MTWSESSWRRSGPQTTVYTVGAEVMMTANLWAEADLVNGGCRRIISLRIAKPVDGRRSRTHSRLSWVSRTRSVASTSLRGPKHLNVGWQHKGVPPTLVWAITAHRALGMTMDRVTVISDARSQEICVWSQPSSSHFSKLKLFMDDCDRLLLNLGPLQCIEKDK